jgi:ATP-dependent RNA circularization protein (DNA/RNA ligase family)
MIRERAKFPRTPHLIWLARTAAREDKVLTRMEAEAFLGQSVVVEEKVDGANLGISFDINGNLIAQNRGNLVDPGTRGQFSPLWGWLSKRETRLFDALENRLIIFGEWCYARHSIHYTRLPDYFLAFDVFDKHEQRFMNSVRRDEIVGGLDLTAVPRLAVGTFRLDEIKQLMGQSRLYDGPMEGIYLRQESELWLIRRAKVVRAEFIQQIGGHWSRQPLVPNRLALATSGGLSDR